MSTRSCVHTVVLLSLGNGIFNGVRIFICLTSIMFLDWQKSARKLTIIVESADGSEDMEPAPPPQFSLLVMGMALAWSQVSISLAVGSVCMEIIATSSTVPDIILNFLAMLFITSIADEIGMRLLRPRARVPSLDP